VLEKYKFLPGFVIVSDAAWRVGGKTVIVLREREREREVLGFGFLAFLLGQRIGEL
jgi:hypothetical protein